MAKENDRKERLTTIKDSQELSATTTILSDDESGTKEAYESLATLEESADGKLLKKTVKKVPGLKIAFEEFSELSAVPTLGTLIDDTIRVNTAHPAWKKASEERLEEYHVVFTVACVLSQFLEAHHSPHEFISKFLASWGAPRQQKMI